MLFGVTGFPGGGSLVTEELANCWYARYLPLHSVVMLAQ